MGNYERKNRIAEALNVRNMKPIELAEKSGISKSSLSSYMSQRWQPKQKPLYTMAQVLGVSEMWLAGYDVPMERSVEQINADELAQYVNLLRKNSRLMELMKNAAKLNENQLSVVENMVNELTIK